MPFEQESNQFEQTLPEKLEQSVEILRQLPPGTKLDVPMEGFVQVEMHLSEDGRIVLHFTEQHRERPNGIVETSYELGAKDDSTNARGVDRIVHVSTDNGNVYRRQVVQKGDKGRYDGTHWAPGSIGELPLQSRHIETYIEQAAKQFGRLSQTIG